MPPCESTSSGTNAKAPRPSAPPAPPSPPPPPPLPFSTADTVPTADDKRLAYRSFPRAWNDDKNVSLFPVPVLPDPLPAPAPVPAGLPPLLLLWKPRCAAPPPRFSPAERVFFLPFDRAIALATPPPALIWRFSRACRISPGVVGEGRRQGWRGT